MSQEKDTGTGNYEDEQADDVATLYSWANLHGAKYRDFSGARQEMRVQMRQRAVAEQARIAREEALTQASPIGSRDQESEGLPPQGRTSSIPGGSGLYGRETPTDSPSDSGPRHSTDSRPELPGRAGFSAAPRSDSPLRRSSETRVQTPGNGSHLAPPRMALPNREQALPALQRSSGLRSADPGPVRATEPAWLAEKKLSGSGVHPAETLQQSRERVASRWFALQGIFGRAREEAVMPGGEARVPAFTVFSLAGGVGKSTIVATLGRALAARGERILLADTCSFGLLPFYFGAREVKPGVLRTFNGAIDDPPVRVLTLDSDRDAADGDVLRRELMRSMQDVGRVLIDVSTGSVGMMRQALRLSSVVLVPIAPDMASVVTLQSLDSIFRNQEGAGGWPVQAWFLLNQFDPSLPLHLDLREVLRQQLGGRLLPFAIHRSMAFSEALAEGMTVIDYAPESPAVEDLKNLVTWVRSASAASAAGHRPARWSER